MASNRAIAVRNNFGGGAIIVQKRAGDLDLQLLNLTKRETYWLLRGLDVDNAGIERALLYLNDKTIR